MSEEQAKILVVDDLSENRFAMKVVLEPLDVAIHMAASGNDALSMMLQNEYAVVLLDVQMPHMDGFETATLMQQYKETRMVPIIFVTAINKDESHVFKGYESGAVDYLFKPVNPDILLSKVRVFVKLFQAKQENKILLEEVNRTRNLQSLGVLAGGIAHDFNNILAAISGNIELARLYAGDGSDIDERLASSAQAVQRATQLTKQLLTFSKGGAPVKSQANLKDILVELSNFIFSGSSCRFSHIFQDDIPLLIIDPGQMSQVFQNIFINAKEAMPDGGEVQISLREVDEKEVGSPLAHPGRYLQVKISDNGPGIDAKILGDIFDPYFSTKEKWNQKGQGLGLAVCRSVVANHDGYITVNSELGNGAEFMVSLPLSGSESNVAQTAPKPSFGDNALETDSGGRVLVLDDDVMVCDVARTMLESVGHDVVVSHDGETAINACKQAEEAGESFHVALLDLTIPGGMGGKEVAPLLRAVSPGCKLVVTSGYTEEEAIVEYEKYGFAAALEKPFQYQLLCRLVADLLP